MGAGAFARLISKWFTTAGNTPSGAPDAFALVVNQSGTQVYAQFYGNDAGNHATSLSVSSLPLGRWVHVGLSFSSGTCKIYINGCLEANTALGPTVNTVIWGSGYWSLGGTTVTQSSVAADLDDWRVYDGVVKTATDFQAIVQGGFPGGA